MVSTREKRTLLTFSVSQESKNSQEKRDEFIRIMSGFGYKMSYGEPMLLQFIANGDAISSVEIEREIARMKCSFPDFVYTEMGVTEVIRYIRSEVIKRLRRWRRNQNNNQLEKTNNTLKGLKWNSI